MGIFFSKDIFDILRKKEQKLQHLLMALDAIEGKKKKNI